ncbi:MAG: hypothetical protein GTO53_09575 [Planctomycetales bacterium]|nr:hypothetical protein [Planctomycetales bacterium]NIM09375.1 hypothetical protein [Planctomycetales bacterium]NIN08842.1 hypothetical protein [Planctomycetales bacterium]NIN77959.1 hypothetical protein [Planctomycetales bacterium]NIO35142.1 hypothetical protein [Planctomycetales bacterium]
MPIEFVCPGCQKTLRVADDYAGRSAKCPNCQTVAQVPAAGRPATPPPPPPAPPAAGPAGGAGAEGGPANPYLSPEVDSYRAPLYGVQPGALQNQPVTVNAVINYAWQVWKDHLGLLVGIVFFLTVVNLVLSLMLERVQQVFMQNNQEAAAITVGILGNLAAQALQLYLGIGQTQITLRACRRQPVEFAHLFQGGPRFLPVAAAVILAGLAVMIGFTLCVIPGIILMLMFWPFYWIVVDAKADILASFSVARTVTQNNVGTTFLLWLTSVGFVILGLLAFCVGFFFAVALIGVMWSAAYLMMSGQLETEPAEPAAF